MSGRCRNQGVSYFREFLLAFAPTLTLLPFLPFSPLVRVSPSSIRIASLLVAVTVPAMCWIW